MIFSRSLDNTVNHGYVGRDNRDMKSSSRLMTHDQSWRWRGFFCFFFPKSNTHVCLADVNTVTAHIKPSEWHTGRLQRELKRLLFLQHLKAELTHNSSFQPTELLLNNKSAWSCFTVWFRKQIYIPTGDDEHQENLCLDYTVWLINKH